MLTDDKFLTLSYFKPCGSELTVRIKPRSPDTGCHEWINMTKRFGGWEMGLFEGSCTSHIQFKEEKSSGQRITLTVSRRREPVKVSTLVTEDSETVVKGDPCLHNPPLVSQVKIRCLSIIRRNIGKIPDSHTLDLSLMDPKLESRR